jgi:hypothetical protein
MQKLVEEGGRKRKLLGGSLFARWREEMENFDNIDI